MTASNVVLGYAAALYSVANAEGELEAVKSQLSAVADAFSSNEELRSTLSDRLLPASTRNQIVDDLLSGKASDVTRALVGMIVSAGQGYAFVEIVRAFLERAATGKGQKFATVTSAVALSEDQKSRLVKALSSAAGSEVEIQNIVDPDLVGGAVTVIGDKVIDGSLRSKLDKMREAL